MPSRDLVQPRRSSGQVARGAGRFDGGEPYRARARSGTGRRPGQHALQQFAPARADVDHVEPGRVAEGRVDLRDQAQQGRGEGRGGVHAGAEVVRRAGSGDEEAARPVERPSHRVPPADRHQFIPRSGAVTVPTLRSAPMRRLAHPRPGGRTAAAGRCPGGRRTRRRAAPGAGGGRDPVALRRRAGGDADADDPAIWVTRPTGPAAWWWRPPRTVACGSTTWGPASGRSIATPPAPGPDDEAGRFNNVDLVSGFRLGTGRVDLAVVTDRGRDQLRFYRIDPATRHADRRDRAGRAVRVQRRPGRGQRAAHGVRTGHVHRPRRPGVRGGEPAAAPPRWGCSGWSSKRRRGQLPARSTG